MHQTSTTRAALKTTFGGSVLAGVSGGSLGRVGWELSGLWLLLPSSAGESAAGGGAAASSAIVIDSDNDEAGDDNTAA